MTKNAIIKTLDHVRTKEDVIKEIVLKRNLNVINLTEIVAIVVMEKMVNMVVMV
jgi:hypothetical protein